MNRPFQFRLERVRALRERAEEQAQEELANSLAVQLKGEAMLRAAAENVKEAREARRRSSSADLSGADLLALQAYMERTELARESAALELDRREAEVEARRSALQQRSQERQVLERLKERRAEDHRLEEERRESAVLDEMALGIHRRAEAAL